MPRVVEITCPTHRTDTLIADLNELDGVVGIAVQRDTSIEPPGDVITVKSTNPAARDVLAELHPLLGDSTTFSITTSEPDHLISRPHFDLIDRETNEVPWESVASQFRKESNLEFNFLLLMAFAGAIACAGLWSDRLQIVIGAMVIAPGFEPLLRFPLGVIVGPRTMFTRGVGTTFFGYMALAASALLAVLILQVIDPSRAGDLSSREWIRYWSSLSASGAFVAVFAGAAGAVVVTTGRSVLTAGVMIALALVPSMAITGMALGVGDLALAAAAFGRWFADAIAVMVAGAAVFAAKQFLIHEREPMG